jgi:hypothetical protein
MSIALSPSVPSMIGRVKTCAPILISATSSVMYFSDIKQLPVWLLLFLKKLEGRGHPRVSRDHAS